MSADMPLWEIFVPCQWNDGTPVRTRHHKAWDEKVRHISGGLTVMKPAKGQWVHEGALYSERVIPVRIRCTEKQIERIAALTIQHYEQLAVMTYVVSERCLVIPATDEQVAKFQRED